MKKILSITIALYSIAMIFGQDEFFQPGSTLGGYGELHWNKAQDADGNQTKNMLDFHRFIIYYGYNWTEKWSFISEVELEHNFVKEGQGELELEQAFVNYHAGNWGFQGGVILPSAGLINEYHEPPLFLSVERPTYSKDIIPTTWFSNGFAFYGNYIDFGFRLAMVEDLEGEKIIADGHIRDGRGKGYKTTAHSWTKNMSATFTGIKGLRIGGSFTLNDAPIEDEADSTLGVQLFEVNAKFDANNVLAVFEYGQNSFDASNIDGVNDWTSTGFYLDLGYNVGSFINCDKLIPWMRISNVSENVDEPSKQSDIKRFGLTWWPINDVAFKFDYGTVTKEDVATTEINVGLGYKF